MDTTAVDLVRKAYAALDAGDIETILRLADPLITIDQSDLLPWGGHRTGHNGLLDFIAAVAAHLDSQVESLSLFESGDRVVQIGRTHGRAVSTGKPFDATEVHVWQVAEGLLVGLQVYVDAAAIGAALHSEDHLSDRPRT